MSGRDLHSRPFDESTIAKLEIFEDYAQAWIPTFVMQSRPEIHIFDFFAGTGYDKKGIKGSPLRILDKIKGQIGNIFQKKTKIIVHFNEFEPTKREQKKYQLLIESCEQYLAENKDVNIAIEIKYYNQDCEVLFPNLLYLINKYPSLVYLDQNGIKFLSDQYFLELEKCSETDFLYFVSSSYFWRFADHEAFKIHFDLDIFDAKKDPYKFIHKNVIKQLQKKIPVKSALKLYPYSLKKGTNIHGIVFGASHPRAVDKFLTIAWKRNELNGEANFDINDDEPDLQLSFFGPKKSKRDIFEAKLKDDILNGRVKNNFEAYTYALDKGHIGNHAAKTLKELKKEGKVFYDSSSPLVTYDNVFKKKKLLVYNLKE